jgi:hypothetical protein
MSKESPANPRVLIFSLRNIYGQALFRCAHFEFENLISQMDSVELLAPTGNPLGRRHQLATRIAFHFPIALNPGIEPSAPKRKYDLFLAVCGSARDLLMLGAVRNWRDACKKAICLIDELWVREMADHPHFLRLLDMFDVVMLYYSQSVQPLVERTGRDCRFLPPGVDTISFCPYPRPPKRTVDVYSMGRRSEVTHKALSRMAQEQGLFYLHDSIAGDQAIDSAQHRILFQNIAKRSRYFIVNPGLIDRPERRGNQIEVSNRYFEGAASGTIMIGERPDNGEFERLFDWPGVLMHLPYGSADIRELIKELDEDPNRLDKISRTSIAQSLLKHDWAYRWETMLAAAGLEPMPALLQRKARLRELADAVANASPVLVCGS